MKALFILLSLVAYSAYARPEQYQAYFQSLEQEFMLDSSHLEEITEHIYIAKFSWLGRNLFSKDAIATYNGILNTIELNEENFIQEDDYFRIKNKEEMAKDRSLFNPFGLRSGTIFHELTHADFDVIIEEDPHHELYTLLTKTIPIWFKRNRKGINAHVATSELLGYTAGNFIDVMHFFLGDIFMLYGLNYNKEECLSEGYRRKVLENNKLIQIGDFTTLSFTKEYADRLMPEVIYIRGKQVDLKEFPKEYFGPIKQYFVKTYNLPGNTQELIKKLNQSKHVELLDYCYQEL